MISNMGANPDKTGRVPDKAGKRMIKTSKPQRDGMVRVTFTLPAREPAAPVSVVGDFNGWNPFAHPLRNRANRMRSASVAVPAGSTLRFRYLADGGHWFDDDSLSPVAGEGAVIAV
jgi:1,4-alpha-glucan branching enzyme